MSEHLLKFLVTELHVLRVHCKMCGIIVEAPVEKVARVFVTGDCPHCKASLTDKPEHFKQLAHAIAALKLNGDQVKVEFVLPADR